MATKTSTKQPKAIASTQSLSSFVKSICDVMRRSNCASALQYVPELTWILFLRILDAQETRDQEKADHPQTPEGQPIGWKRQELFAAGDGKLFEFINKALLPHLHSLDIDLRTGLPNPDASRKQRIIGRIMTAVERVRVDSETNLRDILDKVHEIHIDHVDDTHFFTLSQAYEDLLLKMGEKNSDGGQFFTPREVIRAMVHTVNPTLGQTVYDPCCGTGGFLAIAYENLARTLVDECDLWAILSLPGGVFSTAGAGVKTNLLFFTKGKKTEHNWYDDLSHLKVGKKTPLTLAHFGFDEQGQVRPDSALPATLTADWQQDEGNAGKPFPSYSRMLAQRGKPIKGDSRYSWTIDFATRRTEARAKSQPLKDEAATIRAAVVDLKEQLKRLKKDKAKPTAIDAAVFDLKAVNPHVIVNSDDRTPAQIIQNIQAQGRIVASALTKLSQLLPRSH